MAKRADGAIRVGKVSSWQKSENPRAPRRCKIGNEWVKVWPEKTTGWNNKTPIKGPNEALAELGQLAAEDSDAIVLVNGYEQADEYGITFYAEGSVLNPAPEGAANSYILTESGSKKGSTSADYAELIAAINWNTAVNMEAAAADVENVEARYDFIAKMVRQKDAEQPEEATAAPAVEF